MAIQWRNRRTPMTAIGELTVRVPWYVAQEFVAYAKRTAGGSLKQNRGRRVPVDTGLSRRRLALAGRLNRGSERPPSRILISGTHYMPYWDRRGRGVMNRVYRRFARSADFQRAHDRAAREIERPL